MQYWGATHPRLELGQIRWTEGVGLGNDGNEVDARAEPLHDLDVEGLEGVAGGSDEVQARVHTEIDLVLATGLLFLEHVRLVLVVEELDDGHPRVAVVHVVAEAGSVDNGEADCKTVITMGATLSRATRPIPLKNFSSSSALVISISTVLSTCFWWRRLWSA